MHEPSLEPRTAMLEIFAGHVMVLVVCTENARRTGAFCFALVSISFNGGISSWPFLCLLSLQRRYVKEIIAINRYGI